MTGYVIDPTGDFAKEGAADERHAGGGGGVAMRGVGGHSTKGKISRDEYATLEPSRPSDDRRSNTDDPLSLHSLSRCIYPDGLTDLDMKRLTCCLLALALALADLARRRPRSSSSKTSRQRSGCVSSMMDTPRRPSRACRWSTRFSPLFPLYVCPEPVLW